MVFMIDLALLHDFPKTSQISSHVLGYAKCELIVCKIIKTIYVPYLIQRIFAHKPSFTAGRATMQHCRAKRT